MHATTSSTSSEVANPTLDEIKAAIAAVGPEPIGEYMKVNGFDPKYGGRLLLPEGLRPQFGTLFVPSYVAFSTMVDLPLLYWDIRIYLEGRAAPSTTTRREEKE